MAHHTSPFKISTPDHFFDNTTTLQFTNGKRDKRKIHKLELIVLQLI